MKKTFYLPVLIIILVSVFFIPSFAQPQTGFDGKVLTADGEPVSGALVEIKSLKKGGLTDVDGVFHFQQISQGDYELHIHYLGIDQTEKIHFTPGEAPVIVHLKQGHGVLDDVTITGLSASEEVNRLAYNVTSVDATKLHNTTLDLAHTLDRVAGVRIRETGGVGSRMSFSINGFSGRQVKIFIDGIPIDDLGSSLQLNNIPVNMAERIEVYKGVVPVWLGADALGGAVNIVTNTRMTNFLDVSYSYGSFNTHRSNISAAVTSKKGLTFRLNAYQNYSDNNYKVTLDVADIYTGAYTPNTTVKRFHDTYHNEMVIPQVGFVNRKWADQLLIGVTLGNNYREIQTGARMESVFGAWHTKGNIVMPTIRYKKSDFLLKGLNATLNANFNFGKEQSIDTAFRRYDWYGNYKQYTGVGAERDRVFYKYANNTGILAATFIYALGTRHTIALNDVFTSFDRKGYNELDPASQKFAQPQEATKNITGLSYSYKFAVNGSATVFGKMLQQNAHTRVSVSSSTGTIESYKDQNNNTTNYGYGLATSYFIVPALQVKASYEKTNRLPENTELFGDLVNQESNFNLRPEKSDNINLGFTYNFRVRSNHRITAEVTGSYRDARDYIYFKLNNNQSKTVADNLAGVRNFGGEAELRYSYKNLLTIEANCTYQDIRNMVKYEPGSTTINAVYKDRIPNLPFLFGNSAATLFFNNVWKTGDRISLGYNFLYVYNFYLNWPSRGTSSSKYDIPAQLSHDVNLVYSMKDGTYNIALECRNLTNAKLYDNFSLQKPSRAFNVKLRYFIKQKK